jgi:hypothetical protein
LSPSASPIRSPGAREEVEQQPVARRELGEQRVELVARQGLRRASAAAAGAAHDHAHAADVGAREPEFVRLCEHRLERAHDRDDGRGRELGRAALGAALRLLALQVVEEAAHVERRQVAYRRRPEVGDRVERHVRRVALARAV